VSAHARAQRFDRSTRPRTAGAARWTRPGLGLAWLGLLLGAGCATPAGWLREPVPEPDRLEAGHLRAEALRHLMGPGDPSPARAALERSLSLDPGDQETRLWAAWTAELVGEEEEAFSHWLEALHGPHPTGELALREAHWLATTRGRTRALTERIEALLAHPDLPPALRARALQTLGLGRRALGQLGASRRAFEALGLVRDFWVAGPFDNDQNAGYDSAYPPERGVASFEERYPGKGREVGWRRVEHLDHDGRVPLVSLLDPARWTAAYLATAVHAERARPVALRLSAHRGLKVWLNGELLLASDEGLRPALDQHVVGGMLRPGWNRLLLKVCQRDGPWQLGLRLTEPDGQPAAGLAFDAARFPGAPEAAPGAPEALLPDRGLAGWLEGQPESPLRGVLEIQWWRRLGFARRAAEAAEGFARTHPASAFAQLLLLQAHRAADNPGSALKALGEAERLAPGLPGTVLARVRHEQGERRLERAMRLLAPLIEARPGLREAELLQLGLVAARGFAADALRQTREALGREPDRPWLWRILGEQHVSLRQPEEARRAYRRALELQADDDTTFDRLIELARAAGDTAEALALARKRARLFPVSTRAGLVEADLLLSAGQVAGALEVLARLLRLAPDYPLLHRRRGDALYRQGRREEAVQAYQAALALQPDNPGLREYLDFLVHRPDPVLARHALPEAEVERLLGLPLAPASYPDADAVFVLDDEITHLFADGSSKHQVRQIYRVLTEQGRRAFDHFRVPHGASFRLEAAEVVQPDGSRQEASSIRPGVIHFPSLQPGSTVHVAYRHERASSSWMQDHYDESFTFQGVHPVLRARWVLALPEGRTLQVLRRGEVIQERVELVDGERVYHWEARDVPRLHPEANAPTARELAATVLVSTVPSWEALARWQNSLIQDQFEITEPIRQKTRELTRAATSPLEKLEAIYAFVAREVRYVNHDTGIFGKKPHKAVEVFDNRFGDCKDKATLMIAMLAEVGVQAHYAAVRTADRGPIFWEVPAAQTNHIITYLPAQPDLPEPLFVDGTSRFGHVLDLPWSDQGIQALVLTGQDHRIVETPRLPPERSSLRVRLRAELVQDGLHLEGEERWTGLWAARLRAKLQNEGKQAEELSGMFNRRYLGARLERYTLRGIHDLGPEAGADYALSVPDRVRAEGDSLRLLPLWPVRLAGHLAPRPERYNDVVNLSGFEEQSEIELGLPAGLTIAKLPEDLRLDSPLFAYERTCRGEGHSVRCARRLSLRVGRVPLADYPALRAELMRLDRAEEQELVLTRAAP
jgi:tetratricopeptide (TPR) repeat protein